MEYLWFILICLALVIAIFTEGSLREKKNRKAYREYLKESYGKKSSIELSEDDIKNIALYHRKKAEEEKGTFFIDDITWNDLGMDDVFRQMNTCACALGEEELYHRLHRPVLDEDDEYKRFCVLREYFDANEEDRISVKEILHDIGIYRKTSITRIFSYVEVLAPESNMQHYIVIFLMLAALVMIFVMPGFGVLMTVAMMIVSIGMYLKQKKALDPVIVTFNYAARMLKACDLLEKKAPGILEDEIRLLKENSRPLRNMLRYSVWISNGSVSMDNPVMLLLEYVKMIFHLDLIIINRLIGLLKSHIKEIDELRRILGTTDAVLAAASYMRSLSISCIPEPVPGEKAFFSVEECIHPMIKSPVANSIETEGPILLTGSNASGKSTFLKAAAICALMAQTLGYAPAKSLRSSRFKIYTSMALNDNIRNGESYFVVEIKSLKRILDAGTGKEPVLCCIDEVLRGTNTVERIAASTRILRSLARPDYIAFAATHDVELTRLLENEYRNYHFEEEVTLNDVKFNYLLKTGPAVSRNAIRLLSVMGYDRDIVSDAEKMVEDFMSTGNWQKKSGTLNGNC